MPLAPGHTLPSHLTGSTPQGLTPLPTLSGLPRKDKTRGHLARKTKHPWPFQPHGHAQKPGKRPRQKFQKLGLFLYSCNYLMTTRGHFTFLSRLLCFSSDSWIRGRQGGGAPQSHFNKHCHLAHRNTGGDERCSNVLGDGGFFEPPRLTGFNRRGHILFDTGHPYRPPPRGGDSQPSLYWMIPICFFSFSLLQPGLEAKRRDGLKTWDGLRRPFGSIVY